jgi:hypothetical protein
MRGFLFLVSLLLALPSFGATVSRRIPAKLVIQWGQHREILSLDAAGVSLAQDFLRRVSPGGFSGGASSFAEKLGTWKALEMLKEEDFRENVLRAASLGSAPSFFFLFNLGDSPDQLFVGETLEVPTWPENCPAGATDPATGGPCPNAIGAYTVRVGDTLDGIAMAHHVTARDLTSAFNANRFHTWPHAEKVKTGPRTLYIGESYLSTASEEAIRTVLLHEAAHISDESFCERDREYYGPDWKHNHNEILSAQAAFAEGWADYHEIYNLAGIEPAALKASNTNLFVDSPILDPSSPFPKNFAIAAEDIFLGDFFSNESAVGRILVEISLLPGGRDRLEAAFRKTQSVECRSFQDFLFACLHLNDFPPQVSEIVGIVAGVVGWEGSSEQLATLLGSSHLPSCQDSAGLPRSRIYLEPHWGFSRLDLFPNTGVSTGDANRDGVRNYIEGIFSLVPTATKYLNLYPWDRWERGERSCGEVSLAASEILIEDPSGSEAGGGSSLLGME